MERLVNGQVNGHSHSFAAANKRFSDIPSAIDIPVNDNAEEAVELNLEELLDDSTELCQLLDAENASKNLWLTVSLAYAKQHMIDHAISILNSGLQTLTRAGLSKEKIGLLSLQCWLYLWKSREAPRVLSDGVLASDAKTKEFYLQAATGALNDASRVNPAFPPLFLARGILSLLRASLQPPSKPHVPGGTDQSERIETLRQALKCFDDASRVSAGRNMMAVLGKARALFSLGRYADSLDCYQEVLAKMPDLQDPDPRIGIGCCLWQLTHVEDAKEAWERASEINPESNIANVLISLYHLKNLSNIETGSPEFRQHYQRALGSYAGKAIQLDSAHPMTCATLGKYFLARHESEEIESFARKAVELTDVNAVASDGWYILARKEHYQTSPNWSKVIDFYNRADNARGGGDKGFLPAKFGAAQAQVLNRDIDGAKFRLEKIIQHTNNLEAKVLLGTIYAQEVFENQTSGSKEDKSVEMKKAISYLDTVRLAWKDPKKALQPDMDVLLTLARLYEIDQPDKSLQCLLQLRQFALEDLDPEFQYSEIDDKDARDVKRMGHLPPQLLNNIACFQYQMEKFTEATETFQQAANAYVNYEKREGSSKSDQLVTTISYNLARSYEASGILEEARTVYDELLNRHPDYIDAKTRLSYIEYRQNQNSESSRAKVVALYAADSSNMEVRSLYGWFLSRTKKRTPNIAEDQEQRHYKHTLQHYDKHDQYSLTGMGNLYLTMAREMRRETEQEKDKRRKTYEKAIEFYHKALQLDSRNAYAAQGIGIALVEDRKDFTGAIQIFSKIKDTIKESCVLINLGHVYGELKQFSKAIENYEAAVARDRANDPQILACLGRVWLLKGKSEKSVSAMKTSLDYSTRALVVAPEQIHFKFNIAFVQIQLAQTIYGIAEAQRTLAEVVAAADGLDEAIESFTEIAKAKNAPYPRHDLEQRANMGRNTIRKQLERAVQSQREFEEANATKLAKARELRDEELRAKDERKRQQEATEAEKKRKLLEERQKLIDRSRELAEKRAEEEKQREDAEYTEDSAGERVKRKRRPKTIGKRKKKGEDGSGEESSGGDSSAAAPRRKARTKNTTTASGDDSEEESRAPRKKRKLARKSEKANSKFKSSELIVDSDEEAGLDQENGAFEASGASRQGTAEQEDTEMKDADNEDASDGAIGGARKKSGRKARVIESDDDDNEEEAGTNGHAAVERAVGSDSDMS